MCSAIYLSFVVLAVYSLSKRLRAQPKKVVCDNDSLELAGGEMQGNWTVV